jgi:hypothetical protein
MATLKEQIDADLVHFFNTDEFAELATYKGEEIEVIETSISEQNTSIPGFTLHQFSVLIKAEDVARPKAGDEVTFRGVSCVVGAFSRSEGDVWQVDLFTKAIRV